MCARESINQSMTFDECDEDQTQPSSSSSSSRTTTTEVRSDPQLGWVVDPHPSDGWVESIGIDRNRSVERGRGRESKTYAPREGWWFEQWWRTLSCVSVCVYVVNHSTNRNRNESTVPFPTKRNETRILTRIDRDFDDDTTRMRVGERGSDF